jgi:hypothetical protein
MGSIAMNDPTRSSEPREIVVLLGKHEDPSLVRLVRSSHPSCPAPQSTLGRISKAKVSDPGMRPAIALFLTGWRSALGNMRVRQDHGGRQDPLPEEAKGQIRNACYTSPQVIWPLNDLYSAGAVPTNRRQGRETITVCS